MDKIQLQIGDIVKGVVTETRKTFAEISLGDVKAILPSTEYSWSKDFNIKNVMQVGNEITAVVIILSNRNVILSVKRLKINPWKDVPSRYVIGQKVKGKVNKILKFGAFIELDDGVIGLLHKSKMSDDGTIEPSSILTENQIVEVQVISIETDKKRMAFSSISRI